MTSEQSLLLAKLRRYLPYLGIYAADVQTAIAEIERMQMEIEHLKRRIANLHEAIRT